MRSFMAVPGCDVSGHDAAGPDTPAGWWAGSDPRCSAPLVDDLECDEELQ